MNITRIRGVARSEIPAVILAGGRSSRMNVPDKCLMTLGGGTVLAHVAAALRPQVKKILINSNSDPALFSRFDLPVLPDLLPGRPGPLAGVHTAMLWAQRLGADYVLTAPADTPFLPGDLVTRMAPLMQYKRVIVLSDGERVHPTIGLWPVALAARLRRDIETGAARMQQWCRSVGVIELLYPNAGTDFFFNINTPHDLACAAGYAESARKQEFSAVCIA